VVVNGGPAEQAGIAPGDVAVALDGLALTTSNWRKRLGTYHDGDILELLVFRGDELIRTEIRLEAAPTDTCYLEVTKDADGETQSRRAAWLQA
jgi:predicted metalloprotease with PDZ domain